jgi:hypothetical protein
MGPRESRSRSESRYSTLSTTRLLVTFPVIAAVLLLSVLAYGYLVLGGWSRKLSQAQGAIMLAIPLVAMPIGACLGGLLWGFLGKRFLGFTREEVEPFVRPVLSLAILTRYRNWYLDFLFGPSEHVGAGTGGSCEDVRAVEDVLYEGPASVITAHWSEQTTKEFNLATLKTDWWQARRGTLRITPGSLAFGDWSLRYTEIDDAVVTLVKGIIPSYVIRLKSHGESYQFSVTGSYFGGELPFPARRTTVKGFTCSYLMARLLPLIGLLALFLCTRRK